MTKEEEEYIKQRERNIELMEEIAREIEITCLGKLKWWKKERKEEKKKMVRQSRRLYVHTLQVSHFDSRRRIMGLSH